MADTKEPKECFEESKEKIQSIPAEKIVTMNMPLDEAMQEGRRVEALTSKYFNELSKSDINPDLLKSISVRVGAFAYTVALMDSLVKIEQSHSEKFQLLKKEGYATRKQIVSILRYVFRNDKAVLNAIDKINKGKGDLDMIRDLLSSRQLCNDYISRLQEANVDLTILDRADSLYNELSKLVAQLDIDPDKVNESRTLCMKTWTYLWEAMDEIYQAGRFVFFSQPQIEELFYIDYLQMKAKLRNTESKEKETVKENSMA